jgi:hypothetical protein
MIYDVHMHFRNVTMMARALAQAERLDLVLCTNSINLEGSSSPNFPSRAFVTACNDRTLELAQQHPQRIIPFWYLNPVHGQFACDELERRVKVYRGRQGVKLWEAIRGNNPKLDGIMQICAEYRLPVLQHTFAEVTGNLPTETSGPDMREMALRHPDVSFFFGHAAGDIEVGAKCALGLPNVFMDVGGNEATNGYTEILVKHVGASHVVYGSDGSGRSFASQLSKILGADLTPEERDSILFGNVQRIFERQQELSSARL